MKLIFPFFLLLQGVLLFYNNRTDITTNGDDAKYYCLGQALLSGEYRNISDPAMPIETQWPPVWPAMIAAASAITPSMSACKALLSLLAVASLVLSTLLFHRLCRGPWWLLALLVACSRDISVYANTFMSETAYLALSLLALWMYRQSRLRPWSKWLFWAATVATVLPANTRSIGLAFSAAYVLSNLLNRRWKYAIAHSVLFVGAAVAFRYATSWDNPYMLMLFQRNSYDPGAGLLTVSEFMFRASQNIPIIFRWAIPQSIVPESAAYPILAVAISIVVIIGIVRMLIDKPTRMIALYVVFYIGIMATWQSQWISDRFIMAVLPFLYWAFLKGAIFICFYRVRNVIVATCLICAANIYAMRINPWSEGLDWKNFYACADWCKKNVEMDAIVVSRKPELFYLRSGLKGRIYPFSTNADSVVSNLYSADYVVIDNFAWTNTTRRYLVPAMSKYSQQFPLVHCENVPVTCVARIKK